VCLTAGISLGTTWLIKLIDRGQLEHGAAKLRADDIKDIDLLAARLLNDSSTNSDPASAVWAQLSDGLRAELSWLVRRNLDAGKVREELANELNQIISATSSTVTNGFSATYLLMDTELAAEQGLNDEQRVQHNRAILWEAFQQELEESDFDPMMILHHSSGIVVGGIFVVGALISWLLSRLININKFSLHAVYRDRLIRGYLGASNRNRRPNPFTGFDPKDNLCMAQLNRRPFHIVNMALNLVAGEELAWQQRKAESFTASPLHAGNLRLGYRPVDEYASGHWAKQQAASQGVANEQGLRLGTAMAISGAAASPNSGYHSSPIVAALMTLFNVRLGAWFGNPGRFGEKTYTHRAPHRAFLSVMYEALGLTNDSAPYVYLSDGGHFENLGLYEMVLRRCRYIVLSDAGCDPCCSLEDLGNAIRKIRNDLGIPIEIEVFKISSRKGGQPSKYCAIGNIYYNIVDGDSAQTGKLIYIKPAISGQEPRDVFNYKETSLEFPHEPTSDQWFSESQFESYRALGAHTIGTICKGTNGKWAPSKDPIGEFLKQAEAYLS